VANYTCHAPSAGLCRKKYFKTPPRHSYFHELAKIAMLPVIPNPVDCFRSRHPGSAKGGIRVMP
jgi:hypothetical protein